MGSRSRLAAVGTYLRVYVRFGRNARLLLLATVCIYTSLGVFGVLFNLYLVTLHYALDFIGLLAAIGTIGQAAISPLAAWALRRFDARLTMIAGCAGLVVTLLLASIVTESLALVVVTVLSGAALSIATIPASPYMMLHARAQERSHLFSAYFAATTIGSMLGSLLSGGLPSLAALFAGSQAVVQYRIGLIVGSVLVVPGVWLLWRMREELPTPDSRDQPVHLLVEEMPESRTRNDVLVMVAATGILAIALGATLPFFNVYFSSRLHADTATIGSIFALSGIACTVAAFVAPAMGRRGSLGVFSATRLLTAPIFLFFWLHPGLLVAATAYIVRNILATISGALENTFAMEVMPARLRGSVASWRAFSFNACWSLGSLLAGVTVDHYGYDIVFIIGGVVTALGTIAYFARFKWPSDAKR